MTKKLPIIFTSVVANLILFTTAVSAHEGEEAEGTAGLVEKTLEDTIRSNSIKVVVVASILVLGSVALTILLKHQGENLKKILFAGIVIPVLISTIFLASSTIYLNSVSSSGGPVHWHADFEIWDCGQNLELTDPQGFSNRVGSATFHEHNDNRIHVEGVVTEKSEASLGRFFQFVGGNLYSDGFKIPTNQGLIVRENGDLCPDGREGTLQAFVYKTEGGVFRQEKLSDPVSYILSPYGNVPPGDCIILEFDSEIKETTDKLCDSYKLQKLKKNIEEDSSNGEENNHGD